MTVAPSITPNATVTGLVLVCAGMAALATVLNLAAPSITGGWRSTMAAPVMQEAPAATRGTHAQIAAYAMDQGEISAARGRN
jgi:hypothetical protein